MLWTYPPVVGGLIHNAVANPHPLRVARIEGVAGASRVGDAAYGQFTHLRRRRPAPSTGSGREPVPGGFETLLAPATLSAIQEIGAAGSDVVIRAMVTAAKADGTIDPGEQQRIARELVAMGATPHDRTLLQSLMAAPLDLDHDLDDLVRRIDNPALALEAYTASLLAIEVNTPAERDYLAALATRLHLERGVVERLHRQFDEPLPL